MDDQHEHLTDEIADHEARARLEFLKKCSIMLYLSHRRWQRGVPKLSTSTIPRGELSPQTSTLLLPFQSGLVVASGLYEGAAN